MSDATNKSEWYYVRNWWKYQHYANRNPPWIKLHRTFFTDPDIASLSDADKIRWQKLWFLAAEHEGRIPLASGLNGPCKRGASTVLQSCTGLARLDLLSSLLARLVDKGLISLVDCRGTKRNSASKMLALDREEKSRVEEEENTPLPPTVETKKNETFVLPDWIPRDAWDGFVEMRKRIRKPMTVRAMNISVQELDKIRASRQQDPGAVLDNIVLHGWQGIYPIGGGGNGNGKSKAQLAGEEALANILRRHSESEKDSNFDDLE